MRILFSPLGMTDPIAQNHDGAMLHICRYYDIDKVYFYMSKEICELEKERNYSGFVRKLSEHIGHNIEVDNTTFRRPDLEDVQKFDYFIKDFEKCLKIIREENKDNLEIYLNVSSGTPAMKSALQFLTATEGVDLTPIQVTTPRKASNFGARSNSPEDYDLETAWKKNEDNIPTTKPRFVKSDNDNLLNAIQKKMLQSLIERYDYVGALILAENMSRIFSDTFMKMLDGAAKRVTYSSPYALSVFKEYDDVSQGRFTPTRKDFQLKEYLRMLEIRARKKEYGDFLRGITPFISEVFKTILHNRFQFDVTHYCNEDGYRWNLNELQRSRIWNDFNNQFRGGFHGSFVSSDHLLRIIGIFCPRDDQELNELYNLCDSIRDIEENLRNIAAHEIVHLSDDNIIDKTDMRPMDIVENLREVLSGVDASVNSPDFFKSYDKMNEVLLRELYTTTE